MVAKKKMVKKVAQDATDDMLEEFDTLCEKYSCDDIDTERLSKGVQIIIDSFSE